jgi:HAD superfamily hydrolase (TIGR01509 family)
MKNLRPFDAIIFDHDGTLIDTEDADFRACQILYQELGAPFKPERWAALVVGSTNGYDVLFAELVRWRGNGLTQADLWQRLRELWQVTYAEVKLVPGAARLVADLRATGYPLAVASASNRDWLVRWLTKFDLVDYFQVLAGGDNVNQSKPAPDVYLFAAAQLGIKPERCLVFEDSLTGVQAAKSAGMTVVAVPSHLTRRLDFSRADEVIEGLDKVTPAWLAKFSHDFI